MDTLSPSPLPQTPNPSPYRPQANDSERRSHPALTQFAAAFIGASEEESVLLCAAYDKFEAILRGSLEQMPELSDIQFVGGGVVWIHANGKDRRTSISLDNEDDILTWARIFGRGGDGADRLSSGASGAVENAIDIAGVRLRMTFRRQFGGYALNIRILSQEPPTLGSDRFARNRVPQNLVDLVLGSSDGLLLFTGPTGSGKSTMQAALVAEINATQNRHIYTLEDPIEFVHASQNSLVTQRQIGTDVDSFEQGLITAKRSKPGVILLGELRDKVVMRAAIESAGEGHLVLATSHASDAASTISSFIGSFTADEQQEIRQRLAGSLRAIIVQKLVPAVDGRMVPARELLIVDNTIQSKIRETSSSEKILAAINSSAAKRNGTFSKDDDLIRLCEEGQITADTALLHSVQHSEVEERLKRKGLVPAGS